MNSRRSFLGIASASAAAAAAAAALPPSARAQTQTQTRNTGTNAKTRPSLYIKDWGKGPPVILSHGWPFHADSWDYHALVLAEAGYRVISFDRRGFGRSAQPFDGYDYDTFADDLAYVIDTTGVRDVTLVGFSMGGAEVLHYLARHGAKKVIKAAFVGAAIPYLLKANDNPAGIELAGFEGIKDGLRKDRPKFLAGLLKDFFYDVSIPGTAPVSQEVLDWSLQMALQAGLRPLIATIDAVGRTDLRRDLAAVTVPSLVIHGTADKPVPIELARAAAAGMKGAKLIEYKGATHGILVSERDRVAKDLLEHLKG